MYISVVPLVRTIRGVEVFTYQTEIPTKVGQLLRIPWRTQVVLGVVQAVHAKPFVKAKQVVEVLALVLPTAYVEYVHWFAQFYRISLPAAYHAMLPALTKRGKAVELTSLVSNQPVRVAKRNLPAITELVTSLRRPGKPATVLYQHEADALVTTKGLSKTAAVVVVLLAEEHTAQTWAEQLQGYWITTSSQRTVRFAFEQLLQHKPGVYVGTKRLALLPITEADVVIVVNPELPSHKQWDQNPRYHVLRVAQFAARRLVCFSEAPRVEQYATHRIRTELLPTTAHTKLLQVALEPAQPLAHSLIERLQASQCAVVWHNRKGVSRYLQCSNCAHVMPTGTEHCAQCGNHTLRPRGFGATYLMRQLQLALPDHDIVEVTTERTEPLPSPTKPTIYVGTTALFSRVDWSRVELAIVTTLDAQLAMPDFRAAEHTLQQLIQLRNRVPKLAVQTSVAEHPLMLAAQQVWPVLWYAKALAERKQFHYPPMGEYSILIHRVTRQERVIRKIELAPEHSDWLIDRER